MTTASLPLIVRFLGTDDCGAGATCPHCGATGRYVIRFQVEDGRQLGAMHGCVKLFPVTELARQHEHFKTKEARYRAQSPPWKLSARDAETMQMLEEAIEGRVEARQAVTIALAARAAAKRSAQHRGRR
jgi:hypothetical protein